MLQRSEAIALGGSLEASEFLELSQMEVAERVNHVNARRVGAQKLAIVPNEGLAVGELLS